MPTSRRASNKRQGETLRAEYRQAWNRTVEQREVSFLSPSHRRAYLELAKSPVPPGALAHQLDWTAARCLSVLRMLEHRGLAHRLADGCWQARR